MSPPRIIIIFLFIGYIVTIKFKLLITSIDWIHSFHCLCFSFINNSHEFMWNRIWNVLFARMKFLQLLGISISIVVRLDDALLAYFWKSFLLLTNWTTAIEVLNAIGIIEPKKKKTFVWRSRKELNNMKKKFSDKY